MDRHSFIPFGTRLALQILEDEGPKIDFVFFDWKPDARRFELLNLLCTPDAIHATHDFVHEMKGEEIVVELRRSYGKIKRGRWFLPRKTSDVMEDGFLVNGCPAYFVPETLLAAIF